jgi:hypothetical protein
MNLSPFDATQQKYRIVLNDFSKIAALAHVLNSGFWPIVGDDRWPMSKMDFRSNEADRIARDAG